MKRLRGTVKNNVVVLEEGSTLPEGTVVEVRPMNRSEKLKAAVHRIRMNPINRPVGIDQIIEEDKKEREEH